MEKKYEAFQRTSRPAGNSRKHLSVVLVARLGVSETAQIILRHAADRNLTQNRLAKASGMSPGNLSKLLSGQRPWTVPSAIAVSRALGLDSRVVFP